MLARPAGAPHAGASGVMLLWQPRVRSGRGPQRRDAGPVARGRADQVDEEHFGGGALPGPLLRTRLPAGRPAPGWVHRPGRMDHEPSHRLARPAGPVGVIGVGDLGAHLSAVGQQLDQRRLVGDQRAQPDGIGGDQREPGDGSGLLPNRWPARRRTRTAGSVRRRPDAWACARTGPPSRVLHRLTNPLPAE